MSLKATLEDSVMRIGADYDDVLVPFLDPFFQWYNEREGTDFVGADNTDYDLSVMFGNDLQYWVDQINQYHHTGLSSQAEPNEGAVTVMEEMQAKGHEFVIVTSRPEMHRKHLELWVARHVGHLIDTVVMFNGENQHGATYKSHSKGDVCVEHGIDVLIDDFHGNTQSAVDAGVRAVLFGEHGWNEPYRSEFEFVSSWDGLREVL